jgi:hypothetical protein
MEDNNLWGENASADLMNSIEQTDSEFLKSGFFMARKDYLYI